jgi:uncharacterized protein (TIGR01777 family)
MNIVITGASGFIGRPLAERLRAAGHTVSGVSLRTAPRPEAFANCDAVVHLAGEPVAQRWTAAARERIMKSRVEGTRALVEALAAHPPSVLVSASAIGYYGSRGDEILNESSTPSNDFLGQVAVGWEREAYAAEKLGVRVVTPRIGVVLGRGGGVIKAMVLPFRLCAGGRLGSGKQWMSWIHLEDLVAIFEFAIATPTLSGPVNAVAPNPVTNSEFTRELARTVHRPAIFPVPAFAIKLVLGEMSQILLGGQRVVPEALLHAGFRFQYSDLGAALRQILAG